MLIKSDLPAKAYTTPLKIWIILIVVILSLGALIMVSTNVLRERLLNEAYANAAVELRANAASLSSTIEGKLLLSNGLKAFTLSIISNNESITESHFDIFASQFIQQTLGIRNLSIYPDGISTFVYPLKSNESMLGLNLFKHPDSEVRENADRTRLSEGITLLGPFELTQGGLGVVSRQSIYNNGQFWGFVSVVLDVPSILLEADLYNKNKDIELAIRANDQVILGDPLLFDKPELLEKVVLSDGYWELSAVPKQALLDSILIKSKCVRALSFLALLLVVYFLYIQLTQKAKLHVLVKERTLTLETTNRQLEITYFELTATEEELRSQFELLENKEQAVRHMAYHDSVTGLYNRTYFNEQLNELIAHAKQHQLSFAILFLDLDNFKMINDTSGHLYGDLLLKEVGRKLSTVLLEGETISRIGGDEFTILVPDFIHTERISHISQAVLQLFQQPFLLQGTEQYITASMGISIYPDHGQDVKTLLKKADTAMYRVKEEGKNQYLFYDDSFDFDSNVNMEIKNSLRRALENNEFLVYYQPQIEIESGHIVGLEALIRWNHPQQGMIPPSSFIPIAEETGLIVAIGERVLQLVCEQSKAWQEAGIAPIRIAVNLSVRQFRQKNFIERINQILEDAGIGPDVLELEITENIAMKDDMLLKLNKLSAMGFTISIDDFGTQYSSLSYLKRLPVNKIKIDRSFVNGISNDHKDEAIIQAMLLIAQRLNLSVIAEGVETSEQLTFLHTNHCTIIQGFLYFKPLPAEQIMELLVNQAASQATNPISQRS